MKYSGIIFDFNGTLLFDTPMHEQVWRDYSVHLRGSPLSEEEFLHMHGRPTRFFLEYLLGRSLSESEIDYHSEEKEKIYRKICLDLRPDLKLTTGACELLDFLKSRRIPRTIATASIKSNVDFYFETFHLSKWFDYGKVIYDDGSFPGKPDPQIYLRAAQKLSLPPQECIVAEDALSGIESAHSADIGCIVAIGPEETHTVLKAYSGVKHTIADFTEFDRNLFKM
jgi:beta-phosphoglucomutase-like phosphatase (HAD superfamily)